MNKLTGLDVVEVSLVTRGANRKKFALFKSEEGEAVNTEILKAVLETPLEDEQKVDEVLKAAKLSEKAQNAVKGALRLLNAYREELPKDVLKTLADLAGYEYPAPKEGKDKYAYPAPTKKADGSWDFSGIPEGVRPMVEALWKENEEIRKKAEDTEKLLKAERDERLRKEFIAKAAGYKHLAVQPEEFGLVLKALAEKAPEELAKIEAVLKAADEAIGQGKLFAEAGRGGEGAGSTWAKIEKMASEIVQKDGKMTREQAIAKVLEEHPELYDEYLREREKR
ncbi:MAG: hypothetical protein HPY55_15825 [Firmicutes bacterium]|nr:hypothetical protein [Bacillota bacterium]